MTELRGYDEWKTRTPSDNDSDHECTECGEDFSRDQLNARGYCSRCAPLWDGDDPNYDPTTDDGREFPFAENH